MGLKSLIILPVLKAASHDAGSHPKRPLAAFIFHFFSAFYAFCFSLILQLKIKNSNDFSLLFLLVFCEFFVCWL